jgi:hypothetical protein
VFYYMYCASKTGNPLTLRGEILQTILVKIAPGLFRTKSFVFQMLWCEHYFHKNLSLVCSQR